MQTFLPYPGFVLSAACLDTQRLGKQRIESQQVLRALTNPRKGWREHVVTRMWCGYEPALALYSLVICDEWIRRGYNDSQRPIFRSYLRHCSKAGEPIVMPPWLGDERLHSSHRAALLFKAEDTWLMRGRDTHHKWYQQFGWVEAPVWDYWWPPSSEQSVTDRKQWKDAA